MADLSSIPTQQQDWPGREAELTPAPDSGLDSWTPRARLTGRRALVTGADSGIGRAVAIAFAKEGASVVLVDLPEGQPDLDETQRMVERVQQEIGAGATCSTIALDLRTARANQQAVQHAVDTMGGLDVVVANAAYQMTHPDLQSFPDEQIERTFATNVFSPFWLVKAAEPHLGRGSSITFTTSVQAYDPSEPLLDYAATKAGLTNMAVNLAGLLGEKGIRVNAVAPGPIWTPLIPATMAPDKVEGFGTDTPLGRAGDPLEVAAAYVFLASDEASYVSGTVLGVTGGRPVF